MISRPEVGLLGGTFDPIHQGHLAAAYAAQRSLDLEQIRFIPSARPPHRSDTPRASAHHRLTMLRLAVAETMRLGIARHWEVSDLEVRREGPSYTFDTLQSLHREGLTPLQICFIIGADAFAELASWHRYPEVLDQAHFAVVTRPGTSLTALQQRLPELAPRTTASTALSAARSPRVVLIEADTPDISSTVVRKTASQRGSLAGLVTPDVATYITDQSLYQHSGH